MDEHTALVSICGIGAAGTVALTICNNIPGVIGFLAFCSGIALYIIGTGGGASGPGS